MNEYYKIKIRKRDQEDHNVLACKSTRQESGAMSLIIAEVW